MASAIMHICVAKKLNDKLHLPEKDFFLGSIAPDISKQIGETKEKTHFLSSPNTDVPDIDKFLSKYKIESAFDLGYYVHLLTDYYFYYGFLDKLVSNTSVRLLDGTEIVMDRKETCKIVYNDYTNINTDLIDHYALDLSLFYDDFEKPVSKIEELPLDKLNILINKMGIILDSVKTEKSYIFDIISIIEFIDETVEKIENDLKMNKNY